MYFYYVLFQLESLLLLQIWENSYFSHDWINYFLKIFEIYPLKKKKILILSWIMEDGLPTTATIGNNTQGKMLLTLRKRGLI